MGRKQLLGQQLWAKEEQHQASHGVCVAAVGTKIWRKGSSVELPPQREFMQVSAGGIHGQRRGPDKLPPLWLVKLWLSAKPNMLPFVASAHTWSFQLDLDLNPRTTTLNSLYALSMTKP